jgi:uncharacterized protein (TIGR00255 family)
MLSMTGFGQGQAGAGERAVTVQISSVNHRGAQVNVRSDLRDLALDELVRSEVRAALVRGAITVQVQVGQGRRLAVDRERLAAAWRELAALAKELGAEPPRLERVAGLVGGDAAPGEGIEQPLRVALAAAIAAHLATRRREGAALARAFAEHAAALRALLPRLRAAADARAAAYRDSLRARLAEVLAGQQVTAEQLVRELAMHAERIDVTEELVRLAAHCDALDALLAGGDDQLGRKLDFLLQEIGREINTTGAKSNDTALTALVLEGKAAVEQMKEQAANVC